MGGRKYVVYDGNKGIQLRRFGSAKLAELASRVLADIIVNNEKKSGKYKYIKGDVIYIGLINKSRKTIKKAKGVEFIIKLIEENGELRGKLEKNNEEYIENWWENFS